MAQYLAIHFGGQSIGIFKTLTHWLTKVHMNTALVTQDSFLDGVEIFKFFFNIGSALLG